MVLVNRGFFVNGSFYGFVFGWFFDSDWCVIIITSLVIRGFGCGRFVGGFFIDRSFGDCCGCFGGNRIWIEPSCSPRGLWRWGFGEAS